MIAGGEAAVPAARERLIALSGAGAKIVVVALKMPEGWKETTASLVKPSKEPLALEGVQGVWVEDATGLSPADRAALRGAKGRGATIGGGPGLGSQFADSASDSHGLERGLAALEGAIVVGGWSGDSKVLQRALEDGSGLVAVGIPSSAALVVQGRGMSVVGAGDAGLALRDGAAGPFFVEVLKPGARADWIQWRRRAIEQTRPVFPPKRMPEPIVPKGTLFIVGGGGMPAGLLERFIEAAGGPEAPLVYVPCEFAEEIVGEPGFVRSLRSAGAKNVTWIHTKDRNKADSDPEILSKLREAGGVWFGGGRQWNLVDSYHDTESHRLMLSVLDRGGAIGGSSAGASIQSQYMPRGDPLGNTENIAPGYERGLGFLPGVGVDQHFTQRKRHPDMTKLMARYPQILGIGLDESTAIVVRGSVAEVTGRGSVFVYDRRKPVPDQGPDFEELKAGDRYELKERRRILNPLIPLPRQSPLKAPDRVR